MRAFSLILALAFFFSACQSGSSEQAADSTTENTESTTEETPQEEANKYTLTPFEASQEFADASIESMDYKEGKFSFGIGGASYELGAQTPDAEAKNCANSGKGQHIHLIVDNAPYAAKYTADFEYDIADGEHYLLAFLSRSYHESIKTSAAHVAQQIKVSNKAIEGAEDVTSPMLFYSRPKGTYTGEKDTKKVMLDFYLSNVELGDEYKVKAEINGEEHLIDTWQPYYIEGLPIGDNTVTLTLIDKDGNAVDAPLNPVSRTFKLQEAEPAPSN